MRSIDGATMAAIAAVVAVAAITSPDGMATVLTVAAALSVGFVHTQTLILMRGIGDHGHHNTPLTTLSGWLMGLGWFITPTPLKIALGAVVVVQFLNAFGRYREANSLRSEKERREKENLLREEELARQDREEARAERRERRREREDRRREREARLAGSPTI